MHTAATPVAESERLEALDILRGFAVLGILLMNIQMFAMPFAAYFNPYALGEPTDRDLAIWSMYGRLEPIARRPPTWAHT